MPDLIALELVVALVCLALLAGMAIGRELGRRTDEALVDDTAREMLAALVTEQIDDDRDALRSLPPGVSAADAWALAAKLGISVREAAEELFTVQARARLRANVYRHHGGGPR